jgi:hypothetical protein
MLQKERRVLEGAVSRICLVTEIFRSAAASPASKLALGRT